MAPLKSTNILPYVGQSVEYDSGANKTVQAIAKSGNRKLAGEVGGFKIHVGDFYRNHASSKGNGLTESEISDTLDRVDESFRASDARTSYRKDNTVLVSNNPDGSLHTVIVRPVSKDTAEVLTAFKVSKTEKRKFIENLRSFGTLSGN